MTDGTHERNFAKLRKDFGEVFLVALEDPETVEICLNADGTLWQECLGEPLRQIGTMSATCADAAMRTLASYHREKILPSNVVPEGRWSPTRSRITISSLARFY